MNNEIVKILTEERDHYLREQKFYSVMGDDPHANRMRKHGDKLHIALELYKRDNTKTKGTE